MTPERIKNFLYCFYEQYIETAYQGYEVESDQGKPDSLKEAISKYDVQGYFLKHLDIYIQHCDYMKEYSKIYNPKLFNVAKSEFPEEFNDLEIFLIENIQLFFHTILESAIHSIILGGGTLKKLKIHIKPIDNKSVVLGQMIDGAEAKMRSLNMSPPAMG